MDASSVNGRSALSAVTNITLDTRPSSSHSSKKRKREHEASFNLPFQAKALQSQLNSNPITFIPICWLSRSDIPLAWLKTIHEEGPIPSSFLFNASVIRVHEARSSTSDTLVARHGPNGGLYAIEEVGEVTYMACALQPWIGEDRLHGTGTTRASSKEDLEHLKTYHQAGLQGVVDRTEPRHPTPTSPKKPKNQRGILARKSILPHKETSLTVTTETTSRCGNGAVQEGNAVTQTENQLAPVVAPVTPTPQLHEDNPFECVAADALCDAESVIPEVPQDVVPSVQEVLPLELLHQQYLEALYLSKTSLAYFAKGPLSRVRATFQDGSALQNLEELSNFYRESLLPSKKMELKYKESISKVVETMKPDEDIQQHGQLDPVRGAKKKKKQKKKVGKDGLYTGEEEYIKKWWRSRDVRNNCGSSISASSHELRTFVSELRKRETMMQILIMLEIMALEALPETAPSRDETVIKTEPADDSGPAVPIHTPAKPKKKRNLNADLDPLLDKLCIWQTVGIDELLASPEKVADDETQQTSKVKDKLREFCADVIIPFYVSRLPEPSKLICRRLGGPDISPKRPRVLLTKSSSTSRLPPGAVVKVRPRPVLKRTLERVLSEDQNVRHASPPVLSRSSSFSVVPNLKREPPETSQRPASRGNLQKSVSFSNREIDLVGDARVQDAKRRKLAQLATQKKELNAAIDALKKPNRTKAGQSIMADVEKRTVEKLAGKVVQITATPKRGPSKHQSRSQPTLPMLPIIELPTENPIIPSSTVRPQYRTQLVSHDRSSAAKRAVLAAVSNTPSRVPSNTLDSSPLPGKVTSSAALFGLDNRKTTIAATPNTNRLQPPLSINQVEVTPMRMTKSQRPVLFTPLKKTEVRIENIFRDAPVVTEEAGKAMDRVMLAPTPGAAEASIYDSLGWNDDFD